MASRSTRTICDYESFHSTDMGLHWLKVQPTNSIQENAQQADTRPNAITTVHHWIAQYCHRSQIGHRSEYSVERLLAFRDYHHRTSITRIIAVCVLTPIPVVLVALLIDCTPLRPPSDGWRANYSFFLRWWAASFFVAMGATAQLREVILPGTLSTIGAVLIAIGTASTHIALAIAMAVIWRFPIPFGYVLLVGPFLVIYWSFSVLVIGLHLLAKTKLLRQQMRTQFMIVSAHGLVTIAYPVFTAMFHRLPGPQQLAFVFVMPLIKHFTKQIIATAAADLHEYVAPVVVFSVGLFHVFYTSICMQTAKSTIKTLIMMTSDTFHVIVALRAIFHQANALKARRIPELSSALRVERSLHCLEDLPGMIHNVFEDREISERACPIRVFAPSSLPLSDESISFINEITQSTRDAHVYTSSRLHAWSPESISLVNGADQQNETSDIAVFQQTVKGKQFAKSLDALKHRDEVLPNATLRSTSTRADQAAAVVSRKESIPRRLLTIMHTNASISSDRLRSTLSRQAKEEAALTALQALFHSEYLLMAEYIEFTLPILYAAYLATIFHLPVASYYPQTMSLTSQSLTRTVATIVAYAAVEFVGFIGLVVLLRRKFGISPLHQLAFAFETQAWALQGHLFVWTIFILHLRLEHYGVDFDVNLSF